MATRLESLRVSSDFDASKYTQGAAQKVAADQKMVDAAKKVDDAVTQTERKVVQTTTAFDRQVRAVDASAAATAKMAQAERTFGRALEQGAITQARHAELIDLARRRYVDFSPSADRAAISTRNVRTQIQQAGFQFGDFAVQIASGQNAIVAATQQGSQLLQVFGGPWGAVMGAAASIVGAVAVGLLGLKGSTKEAEDATKAHSKAIEESNALLLTNEERTKANAAAQLESAETSLRAALNSERATQSALRQRIADTEGRLRLESVVPEFQRGAGTQALVEKYTRQLDVLRDSAARTELEIGNLQFQLDRLADPDQLGANRDAQADYFKLINAALDDTAKKAATSAAKIDTEFESAMDSLQRGWDAKREQQEQRTNRSVEKYIAGLEAASSLDGLSTEQKEIQRALIEAQNKLYDDQGNKLRDLTDTEKNRIETSVRKAQTDKQAAADAVKAQRDLENAIERGTDRAVGVAADVIYDGFTGKISSIGEFLKTTLLRAAAEAAAQMVLRPLIQPVVSAAVSMGQSLFGGGAGSSLLGANGSGFGGGAMNLLSLGKMIPGVTGAIDAFGASTGLFAAGAGSAAQASILADAAAAGVAPAEALAGASTLSTTLSAALGAGGIGLTAGMLLGQLTGSRAIGGIGGAGTGALAGFAIGGPVGAVIGGIAGGLGGLIGGGGKEPHPASSTQIGVDSAGNLILGASAAKHADISQSRDPAAQIIKSLNTLFDQYGFLARGGSQVAFDVNASKAFSPEQAIQQLVMSATSGNAALDQAVDTFFGSRSGGMDANALLNAFSELASTFKTIESIDLDPKPLSQVEEALKRINDGADQLRASAEKFGFSAAQVAKIEEARAKALADVTETFNTSISDQILAITDPQELALRELERAQKDRLEEAKKAGADLVAVEKLAGLEREKVIEQFSQQSVDSLKKFMEELTFGASSGVAPVAQLSGSRAAFDAAAAQALAGDLDARDRIVDLGQTFLNASRSVNASTGAYFKDRDRVRDIVSALLGDVPGFASGGSFQVPALAGNDNMIPLIRVSGGETVSVSRNNEDGRNTSVEAVRQQTAVQVDAIREVRDAISELKREIRLLSQKVAA